MIVPISQQIYSRNNYFGSKNNKPKQYDVVQPNAASCKGFEYGYGIDPKLHIFKMDKLKKETLKYPADIKYREQLMANAGLNPKKQYALRSIIGPQEIEDIMKKYDDKPEVFSVGNNFENVNNRTMRANLHIHTTASDGSLTVTELLDKAQEYANKVKQNNPKIKEPFVVAITDHDTTEGVNEVIKVISDNPLKYENLRVILGVEMTTFNNIAPNLVQAPTNTHVLVYGIDPNEKEFKNFIDETKSKKMMLERMMCNKANKVYENHFGKPEFYHVEEAKLQYNTIDKNIIGIFNGMDEYFKTKTVVQEVVLKDQKLKKELEKHNVGTTTEDIMEKLSMYNNVYNGNNKILAPEVVLPEFISDLTGMKKETVAHQLEKGLQSPKYLNFSKELKTEMEEYKVGFKPKYDYMPTFETLYKGLNGQKQAIIGVAHPVDAVKTIENTNDKYSFLEELFMKFKSGCKNKAKFTEAYYQSYKPGRKEFNAHPKTQEFFKQIGKVYKLLRTGSADTHRKNIFIR